MLSEKVNSFSHKKLVVLGDIMLDKYTKGCCDRLSPEDLVFVLDVNDQQYSLGGAGNTAQNIHELGSKPYLVGIVGDDSQGDRIREIVVSKGINGEFVKKIPGRITTLKERIVGISTHHQPKQIVRVDYEVRDPIPVEIEDELISFIDSILAQTEVVVISDYAKGVVTPRVCEKIIEISNRLRKKVIIDPRPQNAYRYTGAYLITPNTKEAYSIARTLGNHANLSIEELGLFLRERLKSNILITQGDKGMSLFSDTMLHIPTFAQEVFDVTGAGDTVVAALSVGLSNGLSIEEAARFANHAAGIVVGKFGVVSVSLNEVKEKLWENT